MEHQFTLFDVLIIIGITQGLITSVLLLSSKKNKRSNPFLALGLIAFCFLSTKILLHSLALWETLTFRYFPNGVELVIAPLLYFYTLALVNPRFKFEPKHYIHFIPFFISQSYAFYVYFSLLGAPSIPEKDIIANALYFNEIKRLEDHLSLLSIGIYLIWGYINLSAYKFWLNNTTSDSSYPDFNWLRNIFILCAVLGLFLLLNLALIFIPYFDDSHFLRWRAYFIFIAGLIYYLGLVGYKQDEFPIVVNSSPPPKNTGKLSAEKMAEAVQLIRQALQTEQVFLNPTLTAKDLAQQLGISQSHLSAVVNQYFEKSFRELINDCRVEEVKQKLKDTSYEHLSILGIALESGFNSEASFYRIFKKKTGLSPKAYLSSLQKSQLQ